MPFLQKTIYKVQVPSSSQNCLWQEVSKLLKRIGASVIHFQTGSASSDIRSLIYCRHVQPSQCWVGSWAWHKNHFQKIWKSYFFHIDKSLPQLHLKKKNSTDLHTTYNIEVYQDLLKKHYLTSPLKTLLGLIILTFTWFKDELLSSFDFCYPQAIQLKSVKYFWNWSSSSDFVHLIPLLNTTSTSKSNLK